MPYFNLAWPGHGLIAVLGWPGQWALQISHDGSTGVRIAGGQQQTHFWLAPGEEVRTPFSVLQFWSGDWIDGQNQCGVGCWRTICLVPGVSCLRRSWRAEALTPQSKLQWANEQNQKEYFARILAAECPSITGGWMLDGIHLPTAGGTPEHGTPIRGDSPMGCARKRRGARSGTKGDRLV